MIEGRISSMTDTRELSSINVLGGGEVQEFIPRGIQLELKIQAHGSFQEAHKLANTEIVVISKYEYEALIGRMIVE